MAAATPTAYPNSAASDTQKSVPALSPFSLSHQIRYSGVPRHLRSTLLAMMRASDGAGQILWPAVKGIMIEAGASRRTVQYNLRRLVQLQVLSIDAHENQWVNKDYFRRTRTYKLNIVRLKSFPRPKEVNSSEWRTYKEYKSVTRKKAARQVHRSPHAAPHTTVHQASHAPAPVPVPSPVPAQIVKPAGITRPEERLQKMRFKIMAAVGEFLRQNPDLPEAIRRAAPRCGLTVQEIERELKLMKTEPHEIAALAAEAHAGECTHGPDPPRAPNGSCYYCYAEANAGKGGCRPA